LLQTSVPKRVANMSISYYEVAQICLNGHVITPLLKTHLIYSQKYCGQCGALTITTCPKCNKEIRGSYYTSLSLRSYESSYKRPNFCHNCGAPYPWTASKLKAAHDLSDELEDLTPDERESLKKSIDDIVSDTPQTTVSARRFNKLAAKADPITVSALKDILVDITSEAAKKVIWPT
jgi:hypothetical protein